MIHNKEQILTFRQLLKTNAPVIYNSYRALKLNQKTANNSLRSGGQKPTTEETLVGNTALQLTPDGT